MPRIPQPLTDTKVRQLKPKPKDYLIGDGNGLFIKVTTTGAKVWVSQPTMPNGKRTRVHLGDYPAMTLAVARERNLRAVQAAKEGAALPTKKAGRSGPKSGASDAVTKAQEEANWRKFSAVAERWLAARKPAWADATYRKADLVVRQYLVPALGELDVGEMRTADVLGPIRELASRAPTLAAKGVTYIQGIFEQGILEGVRSEEKSFRTKGLLNARQGGHVPAITKERQVGALMRAVHAYSGPAVRSAIYLIAWTVMRPGVVAGARWADIDFARREWHVEGKHMKTRHDHIVPLPTQAIEMLKAMYELTGQQEYVFPAMKHSSTPHLHRDTLSKAMRSMGFKGIHSPHGFRAMLRTLARERLGVERDVLEAQLAHAKGSDVEAAYDRTTFGEERRQVMQQWADYLDRLRTDSSEDPPAT